MAHTYHVETKIMLITNSNHSQQIQITYRKFQIIDPARHLQSPTVSGARRLKIFAIHEEDTLESLRHLVAFSSSSTNENHVFFLLQVYCNGKPTRFSFVELEEKATKWHKLSRVVASCKTNLFRCLAPLAVVA